MIPTSSDKTKLRDAIDAARERGRKLSAEILAGEEMKISQEFAALLGVSVATVHNRRRRGELLGLKGAVKGYRFPDWQLDEKNVPYPLLKDLTAALTSSWTVYRFLMQPHNSADGIIGLQLLLEGKNRRVLQIAEGFLLDFT